MELVQNCDLSIYFVLKIYQWINIEIRDVDIILEHLYRKWENKSILFSIIRQKILPYRMIWTIIYL